MDIHGYIRKYGTRTTAVMLRRYADLLTNADALHEMADDLQNALEVYEAHDFDDASGPT